MGYATVFHVGALQPARTISSTSKPNATQVTQFLDQTAAILDGILTERGYTLPVPTTATSALELLEHYNALGGWAFTEVSAPSSPDEDRAQKLWAEAQKMLKEGLIELDIPKSAANLPRSSDVASPIFTRDMLL